jgi:predicted nucleic acid-binding protein
LAAYFFDTSAFVKYYHQEAGTAAVSKIFAEPARRIQISSLGLVETQSAFATKVRTGTLSQSAAGTLRARLMLDIAAGDVEVLRLTPDHLMRAAALISRYSSTKALRTLDALQLAFAKDLHDQALVDVFVVADGALSEVAASEGLPVLNPR